LIVVASLGLADGQAAGRWEECLSRRAPESRGTLPPLFREVSGLALSDDGRLWAHNDESGVIGAFEPTTGKALGGFRLGPRVPVDDFEGIAVAESRLWLVNSRGRLYSAALPDRSATDGVLPFDMLETGVGRYCEVEGLGHDPGRRLLLLACKLARAKELSGQVTIFKWSLATRTLAGPDRIQIPVAALAGSRRGFHPSAIERNPVTGTWLVLASVDGRYAVIDSAGTVLGAADLGRGHPQPEGLAIDRAGMVYVADEGGRGLGTVTIYACR
jgi:uncharacterized protein YjiK